MKVVMFKQWAKRWMWLALEMLLLSILVFYLARQAPGDPLQSFYGDAMESMTEVERQAARERLGLNDGLLVQYIRWLTHALQGDFGLYTASWRYGLYHSVYFGGCAGDCVCLLRGKAARSDNLPDRNDLLLYSWFLAGGSAGIDFQHKSEMAAK